MVELGKFKSNVASCAAGVHKSNEPPDFSGGSAGSGDGNINRLTTLERLVEVKIG
jgi:hypothetical protein